MATVERMRADAAAKACALVGKAMGEGAPGGASFMEDDNNWHYRIPTAEEVIKSKIELGVAL